MARKKTSQKKKTKKAPTARPRAAKKPPAVARNPTSGSQAVKRKSKRKKAAPGRTGRSSRSISEQRWKLHVVSDASGHLAGHLTRTILMGFPGLPFTRKFHVFQNTPELLRETLGAIKGKRNLVVHTVAPADLKMMVVSICGERDIPCLDLTGPFVDFMTANTGAKATVDASDLHQTSENYFRRVEAIEFTADHDDGRNLGTIREADVVLIGLSRVSKSPTSYLLGSMGLRTANVSIVREVGFPLELAKVKKRVVALTIQPRMLSDIRLRRLQSSGVAGSDYSDLKEVIREVMWAEQSYRARGYPVIDTTGRTIEEITAEICRCLGLRRAIMDG